MPLFENIFVQQVKGKAVNHLCHESVNELSMTHIMRTLQNRGFENIAMSLSKQNAACSAHVFSRRPD